MDVTILKRSFFLKAIITFILFYYLYIYCLLCINAGQSFLSLNLFKHFILDHFVLSFLTAVAFFSMVRMNGFSKVVYILFSIVCFLIIIKTYYENSNKLVLLLGFVGMLSSALFYMGLVSELRESIYNPCFSAHDLYLNTHNMTFGSFEYDSQLYSGELTSWSNNGCFFYLGKSIKMKAKDIKLRISFIDNLFDLEGKIVTKNEKGIGILFENKNAYKKWNELLLVLKDRGYVVET